ncbi:MAG: 50S ribosomal protein L28 [Nitrospinota bacterium]
MAKICEICGKKPMFGNNISHAHNVTKRKWNPNLKKVRHQLQNGSVKKITICTQCLKSNKIVKPTIKTAISTKAAGLSITA